MPKKQYQIQLTDEERSGLTGLLKKGTIAARKLARAQILRLAGAGKQDAEIAESMGVGLSTVERTRKKYVEGGLEHALNELHVLAGSQNWMRKSLVLQYLKLTNRSMQPRLQAFSPSEKRETEQSKTSSKQASRCCKSPHAVL